MKRGQYQIRKSAVKRLIDVGTDFDKRHGFRSPAPVATPVRRVYTNGTIAAIREGADCILSRDEKSGMYEWREVA